MVEWVMNLAGQPSTPWWVLGVAGMIACIEMVRSGKEALWGDFFDADTDE